MEWHITVSPDNEVVDRVPNKSSMIPHILSPTYTVMSLPIRVVQLRNLLNQHQFDLIHLHTARAGLLGCFSALGLPCATVYTGHSWRSEDKKNVLSNSLFVLIERYICSSVNMVTTICQRDSEIGIKKGLVASNKLVTICHTSN